MDGLNTLQLSDNSYKDTLQALVKTHFMQKQSGDTQNFEYDIVRGKGKGLVVLLHGAPGVGKTFTAESVAAAIGQPLLQITAGDLGLKPREVDAALKDMFHLASHWNCVLLLDECDIFLTQRNRADVKRNALVSVFLRVLEFYTGVLFLTTNRVGALDEAVNSRITYVMYYPLLNWEQTKEIWRTNIRRIKKGNPSMEVDRKAILKTAQRLFEANQDKNISWNGRQIQNAFKIAVALAYWDLLSPDEKTATAILSPINENDERHPKLTAAHFEAYADGTWIFDNYRHQATGFNDAERAFHAMDRNDDFQLDTGNTQLSANLLVPEDPPRRLSMTTNIRPSSIASRSPIMRPQFPPARQSTIGLGLMQQQIQQQQLQQQQQLHQQQLQQQQLQQQQVQQHQHRQYQESSRTWSDQQQSNISVSPPEPPQVSRRRSSNLVSPITTMRARASFDRRPSVETSATGRPTVESDDSGEETEEDTRFGRREELLMALGRNDDEHQ